MAKLFLKILQKLRKEFKLMIILVELGLKGCNIGVIKVADLIYLYLVNDK
jgi:hypothetical protein